jgi:hypothetical protein
VQVHYGEGVANHTDPESCAAYREVCGEALTGERAGQLYGRPALSAYNYLERSLPCPSPHEDSLCPPPQAGTDL